MKNKKALIIGGSGSIGKAILEKLKNKNFDCLATHSKPSNSEFHHFDFMKEDSYDSLISHFSNLDCIVFAGGFEPKLNLDNYDQIHALKMFTIHVMGPLFLLKKVKKHINDKGSIIFISSVAAFKGSYDPTYSAAKGAINSLTKSLAKDFAPKIRVNAIAPSLVYDSKVFNSMTKNFRDKHLNSSILNKFLHADECADAVYFLSSNEHITGEILNINGGQYFI